MSKSKKATLVTVEYVLASDEPEVPPGPFSQGDLQQLNTVGRMAREKGNVGKGKFAVMRAKHFARRDKQCVVVMAFGRAARRLEALVRKDCPHLGPFKKIPSGP